MAKARPRSDDGERLLGPMPFAFGERQAAARMGIELPRLHRMIDTRRMPAKTCQEGFLVKSTDITAYLAGQTYDPLRCRWKVDRKPSPFIAGTVYLIGFGPYVKIGFTAGRIAIRLGQLQTGAPEKLEIIAQLPGEPVLERILQERFSAHNSYGEWFRREGALAEWIDAGCPMEADNAA